MIAVNFGFMYTLTGRLIFVILLGFMAFLLSVIGKIAMAVLYATMIFQIFIMYKFPRFEEYLRKKHYFEGRQSDAAKGRR
jgi:Na+-translocating ferredoxin:NAD+ oxidoreductase RnfD subunit